MNDFFTNLVSRHLGTCDTIQPRTQGRFEVVRSRGALDSPDEDMNSVISGVNVAAGTPHESDLIGSKKDNSFSSHPTQLDFSESQEGTPSSNALANRVDEIHSFDAMLRDAESPTAEHALDEHARQQNSSNTSIPAEKRHSLLNADVSQDSVSASHRQAYQQNAGHDAESEMDRRIDALLQRLLGGSGSLITQSALDEHSSHQHYQGQMAEIKQPLLNAAVVPLDSKPTSERQTNHQNNIIGDGDREGGNTSVYESLEPPSWLAEIENRFNTPLQDKEVKTEPVINVTIGRVEVRAVQAEAARKTRHAKKPTGVMPLDEYLKKREDRGM
jgi:hypothetical protein